MPFPGWQLPGVMTAGAGQVLLKSAAMVPEDGVVLAGSGPLLLLIAWQYLQAGVKSGALLETTPKTNMGKALRHLPRAFAASFSPAVPAAFARTGSIARHPTRLPESVALPSISNRNRRCLL